MPGFSLYGPGRKLEVELPFGEIGPKVLGGGAKFGSVARPRRRDLTEWVGNDPLQLQLTYMLSDFEERKGAQIERAIATIEKMQGIGKSDPEPTELFVMGNPRGCVPHDRHSDPGRRWYILSHVEDDGTQRNNLGNRIHVSGIITLVEVVEDEMLKGLKQRKRAKNRRYLVRKGDTLPKIAKKMKVKGGWKRLAKLNNIRDPKLGPKWVGKWIRIP